MAGTASAGLEEKIGMLSVDKQADVILLRDDTVNAAPVKDLRNAVVLNMDLRNVDTVMVAGRVVKRDGNLLGVDMNALLASIQQPLANTGAYTMRIDLRGVNVASTTRLPR